MQLVTVAVAEAGRSRPAMRDLSAVELDFASRQTADRRSFAAADTFDRRLGIAVGLAVARFRTTDA